MSTKPYKKKPYTLYHLIFSFESNGVIKKGRHVVSAESEQEAFEKAKESLIVGKYPSFTVEVEKIQQF